MNDFNITEYCDNSDYCRNLDSFKCENFIQNKLNFEKIEELERESTNQKTKKYYKYKDQFEPI